MNRRLDEAYRERVRLGDGTEVILRTLKRDDTRAWRPRPG